MKIHLILPSAYTEKGTLSDFDYMLKLLTPKVKDGNHNIMAFMPLALPTLAALTPKGHQIRIIDENIEDIDFNETVDIVGITFVSFMARRAYQIADTFKSRGVYVVLGGPHVTLKPKEAEKHADTIFIGEAEETWPRFIRDFVLKKPDPVYQCHKRPNLQSLVIPRWDLVSHRHYLNHLVQTTRGCSFNCDFCMIRSLYGPPRFKPVAHVIQEIEEIAKHKRFPGPLKLMFADDNIIGNIKYAKQLFQAMIPMRLRWTSQASINIANDDTLLDLARQSGCDALLIGFESVSQKSLNSINKGHVNKVDQFKQAIEKIHAHGINIYAYIIFGFDDNEPSIFSETLDFIQQMGIEFPLFNILSPISGTKIYSRLAEENRLFDAPWEQQNGYSVCFQPKKMSVQQLEQGFLWSIKQAYSHDAIFYRLNKAYQSGAAKGNEHDYHLRLAVSILLAKELLGQDRASIRFIGRALLNLWLKPGLKIQTILMSYDRFQFARKIQQYYDQASFVMQL